MLNPTLFLFGNCLVRAGADDRTALMNLCFVHSVSYTDFRYGEDGSICFRTSARWAFKLRRLCKQEGITLHIADERGLPFLMMRNRKRAGILIGTLLAIGLVFFAQSFVWDIRISGNETMTESEVLAELNACGFFVGCYIPHVQAAELENRVLIRSDRISWISVFLDGTVARVQIIENVTPPPKEELARPANLVAACDGQIEFVELYRGNCVVKPGQAVRQGELLVSGLYDSSLLGFRYTRAAGRVMARTERSFCVVIPLAYEEKVYLEPVCDEIWLDFFGFSLKIFKSTGNMDMNCDIIEEEKDLPLFGLPSLPIGWTWHMRHPYTVCTAQRTHEQALTIAYAELDRELAALSDQAQLLSKSVKTVFTDDSVILECTLSCIEDIAVQSEFEVSE